MDKRWGEKIRGRVVDVVFGTGSSIVIHWLHDVAERMTLS
jgi:hypothetical protein